MKKLIMLAMMLGLLVGGCGIVEENKALKAKNKELEERIQTLQNMLSEKAVKEHNEILLDNCLDRAAEKHDNALKLNDTKHGADYKKGIYTAPVPLLEFIQKKYKDDCDECYRRFGNK